MNIVEDQVPIMRQTELIPGIGGKQKRAREEALSRAECVPGRSGCAVLLVFYGLVRAVLLVFYGLVRAVLLVFYGLVKDWVLLNDSGVVGPTVIAVRAMYVVTAVFYRLVKDWVLVNDSGVVVRL